MPDITQLALDPALTPAAIAALGAVAEQRATYSSLSTALRENSARNVLDQLDAEIEDASIAQRRGDEAAHHARLLRIGMLAVIGLERIFEGRPA